MAIQGTPYNIRNFRKDPKEFDAGPPVKKKWYLHTAYNLVWVRIRLITFFDELGRADDCCKCCHWSLEEPTTAAATGAWKS